ncbi:DUF4832 domain-containing protein [Actinoplanes sp. CA-252034]|uniref:DUF4832 domain-containing protein n=1 Tax=Actinoplanes sp. CA-252034 TaxID=3239906 RepID=UPI003D967A22
MRSFLGRACTAAAALVVLLPGVAHAAVAPPPPGTVIRLYQMSTEVFANPGRGFFTYTETHLRADGSGHVPLDPAVLASARVTEGHSLVFRIFYLERYRAADSISRADLDLVRADLTAARSAGVKVVARFAYTDDSDEDATPARTVRHIAQLGKVITENADVVAAVQAGFIGRWGEWYSTRNFTRTDWQDRRQVLSALLAATPVSVPIQVRTPQIKRRLAPKTPRVGIHDDCFLAGTDDYGTYTGDDREWLAAQGSSMLVGGETCAPSARSGWANANAEMAAYHWTYLNPSFHEGVLQSWGSAGRDEAARRLGYRLRLLKATLPASARPGARTTAQIILVNDGYAAPLQNRPLRLVLSTGVRNVNVGIRTDLRTWTPGKAVILNATFYAPSVPGTYPMSLSLPDPVPGLATTPAYAIRFANSGVWDETTGRNSLGVSLVVTR